MNATEIKARIEEIEKNRFYLSMKDRWDSKDYDADTKMVNELVKLRAELKKVEGQALHHHHKQL